MPFFAIFMNYSNMIWNYGRMSLVNHINLIACNCANTQQDWVYSNHKKQLICISVKLL